MEMFSHAFMVRALIAGLLIAIVAALVGVSLVLRRNAMIGDGLSHAAFGAFAVATVLGIMPLAIALPVSIMVAFLIIKFSKSRKTYGDAIIAVLSASSLAIGILVISLSKGVNIDLNSYLFGSVLAVGWNEVILCSILAFFVILLYIFLHNRIFAITFDEDFAKSMGIKTGFYDAMFAIICSVVIVLGMRLLGALLISSLIIFPTLTAMKFTRTFKSTVILAVIISVVVFVLGLIMSYLFALPTGATVTVIHLILLCVASILKMI